MFLAARQTSKILREEIPSKTTSYTAGSLQRTTSILFIVTFHFYAHNRSYVLRFAWSYFSEKNVRSGRNNLPTGVVRHVDTFVAWLVPPFLSPSLSNSPQITFWIYHYIAITCRTWTATETCTRMCAFGGETFQKKKERSHALTLQSRMRVSSRNGWPIRKKIKSMKENIVDNIINSLINTLFRNSANNTFISYFFFFNLVKT